MTVLVSLDTESGIIRRWAERTNTHVAGLTNDPEDAAKTFAVIQEFRHTPADALKIASTGKRDWSDAMRDQKQRQLLLEGPKA